MKPFLDSGICLKTAKWSFINWQVYVVCKYCSQRRNGLLDWVLCGM